MINISSFQRIFVIILILLIFFFTWRDVRLYQELQSTSIIFNDKSSSSSWLPHHESSPSSKSSLSVKLIMMDSANCYIFIPIAEKFDQLVRVSQDFPRITANMISFLGVLAAAVSARLLLVDSLWIHRLAVLFFQVRTFFDALDGIVARNRLGIFFHVSLVSTSGYFVDAVADTIGFTLVVLACYIFLERKTYANKHYIRYMNNNNNICHNHSHDHEYLPLYSDKRESLSSSSSSSHLEDMKPTQTNATIKTCTRRLMSSVESNYIFFICLCFGLQLAVTSLFWNRYIQVYHQLLETRPSSVKQADRQNLVLHSNVTFLIMYLWRIACGHSMIQMLSTAILFNRIYEFFNWIKYAGFGLIIGLAFLTEIHIFHIQLFINSSK